MDKLDRELMEVLAREDSDPAARRDAAQALGRRLESANFERQSLMSSLERAAVELEARVQELSLLRRLSEVLAQMVDDGDLGTRVLKVLESELDLEDAALWIAEGEELVWRCGAGRGEASEDSPDGPLRVIQLNEGPIGQAAFRREAVVVHDGEVESRCRGAEPFLRRGSFCIFPMMSAGRMVGVLWLGSGERYAFSTERVRILGMAADTISQGLAASELLGKLSRYSQNLSELVAERSCALEDISRELSQYKAAMADFWRRLQLGASPSTFVPLPGCERLLEAGRDLQAMIVATRTDSGTLWTASALLQDFARDYQAYVAALEHVSCPVLLDRGAREPGVEPECRAA
jgi:putative methionine-R-sulfoxide reductase with GAF domain